MSISLKIRNHFKTSLTTQQKQKLKKFQALKFRGLQGFIYQILFGSNLKVLSLIYNSDKWGTHWYAKHYETHLAHLRKKKLNILEIGIGGYKDPQDGGGSLRMWRTYFPKSRIFGIDIEDKSCHDERRIKTFKCSQVDDDALEKVLEEIGQIDIVIDDGSHINEHIIHTFKFLFPKLSENGIYVIEDLQTSYWQSFGGSSDNLNRSDTAMGFLKQLTDGLNYAEYRLKNYEPTYFDKNIVAIHFYHNIVFIQKGLNNEDSNILS
ncbi:MAG: hypothetical protein QNJ41_25375 [Xenococcaceae cyanobacterium MO_188.B32]|nr:hypothetical protein [Xenococcaceae cyanobacterium MO_188.B32]